MTSVSFSKRVNRAEMHSPREHSFFHGSEEALCYWIRQRHELWAEKHLIVRIPYSYIVTENDASSLSSLWWVLWFNDIYEILLQFFLATSIILKIYTILTIYTCSNSHNKPPVPLLHTVKSISLLIFSLKQKDSYKYYIYLNCKFKRKTTLFV